MDSGYWGEHISGAGCPCKPWQVYSRLGDQRKLVWRHHGPEDDVIPMTQEELEDFLRGVKMPPGVTIESE